MQQPVPGMHIAHGLMHRRSQDFGLGGGLNRKSHTMTSSEIFEKRDFYGTKNEDQKLGVCFKMNLHSIRFSYVFDRFFTFLLLLEKVCAFSSSFLCVHIRTNQTVTNWTKVFRKNFFVKGYSSFSKYRSYRSYTNF